MKKQNDYKQPPPGGYILNLAPISYNKGKDEICLKVRNTGDRPIQVGSHFHFFETNKALEFDRSAAFGKRLNIASTTAVRFEPGDEIEVKLIDFGGKQIVNGFNNIVDGWTGKSLITQNERVEKKQAVKLAIALNYQTTK